jgi:hypothetical protein
VSRLERVLTADLSAKLGLLVALRELARVLVGAELLLSHVVRRTYLIKYQQNLTGRKLALVLLGSNIWPILRGHAATITEKVNAATVGSYGFIEMPLPPKRQRNEYLLVPVLRWRPVSAWRASPVMHLSGSEMGMASP